MVFGFFKRKKEEVPEKDSKTTRVGAKTGTDWVVQTKKDGSDSDSLVSAFDPNMPLPEGVAREDARRWKKLLECLDEHPSFKIMTFDGVCWVDPFTGNLVQAPFEMRETVEAHLAKNQFWKSAKLRSAASLRLLVWEKYFAENLETDQRFHLFQTNDLWWNPWTKKPVSGITVKVFNDDRRRFSRLIAEEMAKSETANPHKIESLEKLKRIMQGLEPEEPKETQRQGITGLGTSAAPRTQVAPTGPHVASTASHHAGSRATGAITAPIAYQAVAGGRVPTGPGTEEPVIIGDESFAAGLAGAVMAQGHISGSVPVGTSTVVQGPIPASGPIVLSGLPAEPGFGSHGLESPNTPTITGVTGVLGPALSVMPGIISLRDIPPGDSEESRSLPGGVPMMRQGDLSAEMIQKLVDSLQRISLVASSAVPYQAATKSGTSTALVRNTSDTKKVTTSGPDTMDDLFPDDAVSGENGEESKKSTESNVSTDSFSDKQSKLDVDRAFARLQAREARTQQTPDAESDITKDNGAIGLDAGIEDEGFLEEEAETAPEIPEDEEKSDPVDDSAEDMEKARSVQNHLLGGIPQIPGIEIGMVYEPVTQLGGDFYFVHKIDDDRFFFMLGDVSGHGVQAALIVSSAVNTLRIMTHERQNWDLTDILCEMNDYMRQCLMRGQFFTAFTGLMTLGATPVLQCVCAGHHPAVRLRLGAADESILEIGSKAMAIGLVRSTMLRPQIKIASFPLAKGDSIAVYTDGFIEAHDENGEELGHTFIHSSLVSHLDEPMNTFITKVVEDVRSEAKLIDDDLTLMILRLDR